ncbi:hypothetical protein [Peterkaempfera sp. SMS 1(5)a]|uniref:hypothetical protein n=1 Tax=Peterkaempfera podocarpi TaxID=3232308 RepID=UPI0036730A80
MRPNLVIAPAVVAVALVALAACSRTGGTGVTNVVDNYLYDLGNRNYSAACQQLTEQLRQQLGDCPATLKRHHDNLPVGEYGELRDAHVRKVTYDTKDSTKAKVYAQDIKIGTGSKAKRSIAANHATDGHGLELTKVGKAWRISGGGV